MVFPSYHSSQEIIIPFQVNVNGTPNQSFIYIYMMLTYKDEVVSHYHPFSSQYFDTCRYIASQTERRYMDEKMSKITFRHKLN